MSLEHIQPSSRTAEHIDRCRTFRVGDQSDTAASMEYPTRRSRMHRASRGKRIELTARDIEIFRCLGRYRYLRSTYLHGFVGGASETRFKERLGDLFHEGYLDRPSQQWQFASARHAPAIYELGTAAARVLAEYEIASIDVRTALAATAHRQFLHSVMICETLASLELGVQTDGRLRFIAWPEILGRAPEAVRGSATPLRILVPPGSYLVPDGLFGIEYRHGETKTYRFFALEADRGTMPVTRSNPSNTSYLAKLAAYREVIARQAHKTHWGVPNLLVLTVTTSEGRVREILKRLHGQSGGDVAAFLFKSIGASGLTSPTMRLLVEPWARAGSPPLRIDE